MEQINKINVYLCPDGHKTITINRANGVTPYIIACRNINCGKEATSLMYMCSQELEPKYEWYRAVDRNVLPEEAREHHDNGGLFLREIPNHQQHLKKYIIQSLILCVKNPEFEFEGKRYDTIELPENSKYTQSLLENGNIIAFEDQKPPIKGFKINNDGKFRERWALESEIYPKAFELLKRASGLVGNPGTNISSSTDIACDEWQKDYDAFLEDHNAIVKTL